MSSPKADQIKIQVLRFDATRRGARIEVETTYTFGRAPRYLGAFAARSQDPLALPELEAATYLHHAYDPAHFEVKTATWKGASIALAMDAQGLVTLPFAGTSGVLRVRSVLKVPRGKWPLGCVRGQCAAVGSLALLAMDGDPERPGAWPMPARYEIRWMAKIKPANLTIHDSVQQMGAPVMAPSIFWSPKGAFSASRHFFHRGIEVQIHNASGPMHRSIHNDARWPWPRQQAGQLQALAKEAIDTALAHGVTAKVGQRLLLEVGPLRSSMAQSYSGMVLVSDRYLDTLPLRRFAKLHDAQVVRAILDALSTATMVQGARASDLVWVPSSIGASLMGSWRRRRQLRDEDMAQILSPVGFLPGVDAVLYSGQSAQAGSFFRFADEKMPLRRHPFYFANQSPTGFRLYRKLRAKLGDEGFVAWRKAMLANPSLDPQAQAQRLTSSPLDAFFAQWLGPYPEVDYAVQRVESRKTKQGYTHQITLARFAQGAVHESVPLRLIDQSGETLDIVWTPQGNGDLQRTLEVKTKGALSSVQVDPEHRLQEVARTPTRAFERKAQGDPRFNNRIPAHLRFVYTGVYFNLAVAELTRAKTREAKLRAFSGLVSWEAGLRRDLRRMFFFSISKSRSTWISGDAGISLGFGRKITGNRRLYSLNLSTGLDWLTKAGFDGVGGIGFGQRISLVRETRRYVRDPSHGNRLRLALARDDDWLWDTKTSTFHRSDWVAAVSYARYMSLAHGHVLAAQVRAYASFGARPQMFRGLVRAGGIGGLSAFGADELLGRGVGMLKAEYRHIFLDSLRVNLLGLAFVRNIGGVAFAGGAAVSDCDRLGGLDKASNYVGQVGYGITSRYDVLGIAPMMMRLDLAVPLGRSTRQCLGATFPDKLAERQGLAPELASALLSPFAFNLSFAHDF